MYCWLSRRMQGYFRSIVFLIIEGELFYFGLKADQFIANSQLALLCELNIYIYLIRRFVV